jgi:hypothetical protein
MIANLQRVCTDGDEEHSSCMHGDCLRIDELLLLLAVSSTAMAVVGSFQVWLLALQRAIPDKIRPYMICFKLHTSQTQYGHTTVSDFIS